MKKKHLFLAIVSLLAAAGLWLTQSKSGSDNSESQKSGTDPGFTSASDQPNPGQMQNRPARLAPPDPSKRFRDFTPEQRVEFARRGHGPGG